MDVLVERAMRAPPARVAAVMFDPNDDPKWIGGARSIDRLTPGPLRVGSRVRRRGSFLGRSFAWVTEVAALESGRRLEMTIVEGPMRGAGTYDSREDGTGSVVGIRNRGTAKFSVPGMGWFVRRSVAADLRRLAELVDGAP